MRLIIIAFAASLMLLPAAVPTFACGAKATARAAANEFSAAKKKPMKKVKKAKKVKKKKKEKVEYMRAVPAK